MKSIHLLTYSSNSSDNKYLAKNCSIEYKSQNNLFLKLDLDWHCLYGIAKKCFYNQQWNIQSSTDKDMEHGRKVSINLDEAR